MVHARYSHFSARLRSIVLTIGVFGIIVVSGEAVARYVFPYICLPPSSVGGEHITLDLKVDRLDKFVRKHHVVDCVFIGTSMTLTGLDPNAFQDAYKAKTGHELITFNFGLQSLGLSDSFAMASIIEADYHPSILVIELGVLSVLMQDNNKKIAENRWFVYRQGHTNARGWLADNSVLYRYFLRFYIWLKNPKAFQEAEDINKRIDESGYSYVPPKNNNIDHVPPHIKSRIPNFKYDRLPALMEELGASIDRMRGVKLVFVEFPIHENLLRSLGPSESRKTRAFDRRSVDDGILNALRGKKTPYIVSWDTDLIPDRGWRDTCHLNSRGARIYSRWLGNRLAGFLSP